MGVIEDSAMLDASLQGSEGLDKQFLAAPVKSAVDKFQLLPEFLKVRGLVKQHLESFNYFVKTEIKKIVRANDLVTSRYDPSVYLRYKDVWIGKPSVVVDGVTDSLTPQKCRLSDMTYAAPIFVNIEYCNGSHGHNTHPQFKKDVVIGRMPIMLRSSSCVLYGKDEDELAKLGLYALEQNESYISLYLYAFEFTFINFS
ncbi:DNA-directed RNA polymerase, subunit 2 [Cynara cardunculus var. scolymus]|uniref:DNA-directed RNA polymerase n=1 Tax=Cynara cardunculus var. scolymus TaxID=59895 RepID=A0A103XW00_CYNCS|nr:DNA-directed RNA polymerase, subunit 2 [Cynara cardunculus var. scolymus]